MSGLVRLGAQPQQPCNTSSSVSRYSRKLSLAISPASSVSTHPSVTSRRINSPPLPKTKDAVSGVSYSGANTPSIPVALRRSKLAFGTTGTSRTPPLIGKSMVPRARLELATHGFSVHCSTELSYLGTFVQRRHFSRNQVNCQATSTKTMSPGKDRP
jgi:hypothetical protein